MCGPAFEPDATIALPGAKIAVMGSGPAVNAVYYNKIQEKPEADRAAFVEQLRAEYEKDIALEKLAAEMVIDAVVEPRDLRDEIIARFAHAEEKIVPDFPKRRSVLPV
jgi:methylmalonyl-CoA decarboxylase subunit alpha